MHKLVSSLHFMGSRGAVNTIPAQTPLFLTISDITVDTHIYSIQIKHSKTEREGKGSTVVISQSITAFCPLSSLNPVPATASLCDARPTVVPDRQRKDTSRSWFTTHLCLRLLRKRRGLPPQLYTSHSLRIGAATSTAALVPTSTHRYFT